MTDILARHRVTVSGRAGGQPLVFVPGYGECQQMWRFITPSFEADHRVVLFDVLGEEHCAIDGYPAKRYESLYGYAADLIEIVQALDLTGATLVGHSVGAMIGLLAANAEPGRFTRQVLIGASPRYLNDVGYHGGFTDAAIHGLLNAIDSNYLGWSAATAPTVMGNPDRPELAAELAGSFARTNPRIAAQFARATFLSDHRPEVARVRVPTLVLQCSADVMVPTTVGEYLHRHIAGSYFQMLDATGHYPHLSAPRPTIEAVHRFLGHQRDQT